ncbi:MoxR family ATPase [soil metagenome]
MTARFGPALLRRLTTEVVGRRRELEVIIAALAAGRHLLLEGPPGTGKSTVLRAIASATDAGYEFVEGNAELTPARLVGSFDPAAALAEGYVPEAFLDGPLLTAMRDGSLLYVEEINRIPEETLNVLITVMSEGELGVPRIGRVTAADGFRLVAAMNPFDAVGTARIASAVYDRCCRLAMDYQSAEDEVDIVTHAAELAAASVGEKGVLAAVATVRDTRDHADVRTGSSVRGAIDLVLLAHELAALRERAPLAADVTLDAAQLALSGRIRVRDGGSRTAEEIVHELWLRHLAPLADGAGTDEAAPDGAAEGPPGKA